MIVKLANSIQIENFYSMEVAGKKSGLVILWKVGLYLEIIKDMNTLIHYCVKCEALVSKGFITNLYGSLYYSDKCKVGEQLCGIQEEMKDLWLILGNFSALLNLQYKLGGCGVWNSNNATFSAFMNLIRGIELDFYSNLHIRQWKDRLANDK